MIDGDFPGGTSGRQPTCQCRRCNRWGFNPWVGKILLEKGMAIHSSILAYSPGMDRGDWQALVHRVAKGQTQLKRLSTAQMMDGWMAGHSTKFRCYSLDKLSFCIPQPFPYLKISILQPPICLFSHLHFPCFFCYQFQSPNPLDT